MDNAACGLAPPCHNDQSAVTGATTDRLRLENRRRRHAQQEAQPPQGHWRKHQGDVVLPVLDRNRGIHLGGMCPTGLAKHHPAADTLLEYATKGCPAKTGRNWTAAQMQAAVDRGNHVSAKAEGAWQQLRKEALEKVARGQARLVEWDAIKASPPPELKVSPLAAVPHKSRSFGWGCRRVSSSRQ